MSKPSIQNIDSLYSSCEGANSFNDLHRMHEEGPVITDPKNEVVEEILFLATALSLLCNTHRRVFDNLKITEVVASLASARNNSLRMLNNEDVTIGSWMLAMNVYHEDNQAMCDPQCTPTSIAVWDIPKCSGLCNPAIRLKELHEMSMCSKSPTLPSDDR